MDGGIHVAIAAEKLTDWMGIPITNALLMSWVVVLLLVVFALFTNARVKMMPSKMQLMLEVGLSAVFQFVEETLESKELARRFFPLIVTIFLFVFVSNEFEFIPGIGSIGILAHKATEAAASSGGTEFIPLFRTVSTDLNMTLALAIVSFLVTEISGIIAIGFFKYMHRFLPVKTLKHGVFNGLISIFVGLIEFVSEWVRLISFSFRLFGNIFAGEVLIAVATYFLPFILPVPFMAFEVFVGFIQAAIFAMLTLFFIKLAVTETAH